MLKEKNNSQILQFLIRKKKTIKQYIYEKEII